MCMYDNDYEKYKAYQVGNKWENLRRKSNGWNYFKSPLHSNEAECKILHRIFNTKKITQAQFVNA